MTPERRTMIARDTCLHPIHFSVYGRRGFRPRNMDYARGIDRDMKDALMNVALLIFADCTNVGVPFQNALLAIYLSGLQHGSAIAKGEA